MSKGRKNDQAQLPLHLVPPEAIIAAARVLQHGAQKYAERNWERGISCERVIAAAQRHLLSAQAGEVYDAETGEMHLSHALCELMLAVTFVARQQDDMPGKPRHAGDRWIVESLNGKAGARS